MTKRTKRFLYWSISFAALIAYWGLYLSSNMSWDAYNELLWNLWLRSWSPTNDPVLNVISNCALIVGTATIGVGMFVWYLYLLLRLMLISLPFFLLLCYLVFLAWLGSLSPTGLIIAWILGILLIGFLFRRRKVIFAGLKDLVRVDPWKGNQKSSSYSSHNYNSSDYSSSDSSSSSNDDSSSAREEKKESHSWPWGKNISIEGESVSSNAYWKDTVGHVEHSWDKDEIHSGGGIFSTQVGSIERNGWGEATGVLDRDGNKVGTIRHGWGEDEIIDEDGKKIGTYKK